MKRYIAILGTVLIATILISGQVIAAWHWVQYVVSAPNCENETNAVGPRNYDYATVGTNGPPVALGVLTLDLGSGNTMGANQEFIVCRGGGTNETYSVNVISDDELVNTSVGNGWDSEDCYFETPSTGGIAWRYIVIIGTSGDKDEDPFDPIYGPEIDAAGWYQP